MCLSDETTSPRQMSSCHVVTAQQQNYSFPTITRCQACPPAGESVFASAELFLAPNPWGPRSRQLQGAGRGGPPDLATTAPLRPRRRQSSPPPVGAVSSRSPSAAIGLQCCHGVGRAAWLGGNDGCAALLLGHVTGLVLTGRRGELSGTVGSGAWPRGRRGTAG